MSTQIKLHERTEEMHDEMLQSEGHLHGGMADIMARLMGGPDYFEEFNDALLEADSIIVGSSRDDGAGDIADLFDGVTEITERRIKQASTIVDDANGVDDEVIEWLEENEGEEVFSIHW